MDEPYLLAAARYVELNPVRAGLLADVRQGVQAVAEEVRRRGPLVSEIVIPRPSRKLFGDYLWEATPVADRSVPSRFGRGFG